MTLVGNTAAVVIISVVVVRLGIVVGRVVVVGCVVVVGLVVVGGVVVVGRVVVGRVVVVGLVVVVGRVVDGALFSRRRMLLFTSLNQPGTSMRQQYKLLSPSLVFEMVKETSPLWILPGSLYFTDCLQSTFVPSVWRSSSLHLELGHWPLPQHILFLPGDQDEYLQGNVTD